MYNLLIKRGEQIAFLVGVVAVIAFFAQAIPAASGIDFGQMSATDKYKFGGFDLGISLSGILAVICAVGMVVFGIWQVVSNPKKSIRGLIAIGVLIAVFFAFYSMNSGGVESESAYVQNAVDKYAASAEGRNISDGNMAFIGGSIQMSVLLLALSFVALIVMPIISPLINRVK